ncbi:MAG: alpha-galactosidase, partial [Burkholderiales bacterium]|nr:alpha-galactosidase [Burkholderiales bacterium]
TYAPLPRAASQYAVLQGRATSLVIEWSADDAPLWRYWGPRLPDAALPPAPLRELRPLPAFTLDHDQPLTLAPTFGVGWFGQSALLAHRDGRDFAQAWNGCEIEWIVPGQALRLLLTDSVAQLRLELTLKLDPARDILTLASTLTNLGSATLDLSWLAAGTLPLPAHAAAVRSYAGQHNHEFILQTDALARSLWRRESRRGRTSHDNFPGVVVTTPRASDDAGLVYGAHLAWSGNHAQTIEWLPDGGWQWQLGEWLAPGEGRIEPGQTWRTPEIVASCSTRGLTGLAANFHAELRARLPWAGGAMRPRPVHLNTGEGCYFDLEPAPVMELATAAAAVGVERFVVDDGWFHGRHHDRAALGDWWPDEGKFPQGLGPLADHVRALGMEFGLWFEPEMVNPDSELHRAHPDWALQLAGRPMLTGRHQLVLDIARPEVADYLYGRISSLVAAHRIDYLKWDHNRDLTTAGGADGRPAYRAQVQAAWALMDRLRAAHPALEIESCSGGGGRIDFGVLRHAHRVWTSDCIDARSRVAIQRGFLQFFPPEIMGAHVGTAPAHSTGRSQAMAFRAAVALPGHLGIEFDLRTLDAAARAELAGWIALYKQWRGLLHRGPVHLGDAGDGLLWQAHGDADELLLLVYRLEPTTQRYMPPLRLTMLAHEARYRLRQVEPEATRGRPLYDTTTPWLEALRSADGVLADGAWLAEAGLALPRAKAETAFILHLRKV